MNQLMADQAKLYQKVGAQSEIDSASPHRLIQLLLQGALDKIAAAKGYMGRSKPPEAGKNISLAIAIVDCLRMSLDKNLQNSIVTNLDDLYEYMGERLLQANIEQDEKILEEVASLLHEIKSGWDGIASNE